MGSLFPLVQALFLTCFLAVRKLGRFSLVLPLCNAQNRLLCLHVYGKIQCYVLLTKRSQLSVTHLRGEKYYLDINQRERKVLHLNYLC